MSQAYCICPYCLSKLDMNSDVCKYCSRDVRKLLDLMEENELLKKALKVNDIEIPIKEEKKKESNSVSFLFLSSVYLLIMNLCQYSLLSNNFLVFPGISILLSLTFIILVLNYGYEKNLWLISLALILTPSLSLILAIEGQLPNSFSYLMQFIYQLVYFLIMLILLFCFILLKYKKERKSYVSFEGFFNYFNAPLNAYENIIKIMPILAILYSIIQFIVK